MKRRETYGELIRLAIWSILAGLFLLAAYTYGPTIANADAGKTCTDPFDVLDAGTKPAVHQLVGSRGQLDSWHSGRNYARNYAGDLTVVYRHVDHAPDPVVTVTSCGVQVSTVTK